MRKPINLHAISFDQITFENIESFCEQKVIENIQLDYKKSLPNGVSKHFAAFSNTKGGLIIVGVEEDPRTGEPLKWEGISKEGKLIDQVHQHAANVVPYPTIQVRFTNDKAGKVFLLIKIHEGGSPPYHTVSDPTIWIRTGNVSTPLDTARQQDLDRLYQKKDKAEAERGKNLEHASMIYDAALERAELERSKKHEADPENVYKESLYNQTSVLTIVVQPFFPEKEIAQRQELKNRITDYRTTGLFRDFPNLNVEQCPGGISYFDWNWLQGHFESHVLLGNGLIMSARDIRRPDQSGQAAVTMNEIAGLLARHLKTAANFYRLFNYTGMLSGRIDLPNLKGIALYDMCPTGYSRWLGEHEVTKIDNYTWPIEEVSTHDLEFEDTFFETWGSLVKKMNWDLGLPELTEDKLKTYFEKDLKYFPKQNSGK